MAIAPEYRPGKTNPDGSHIPDERLAEINKSEKGDTTEPELCPKCDGIGEIAIFDDQGKPTGRAKACADCEGTGAIL